MHNTAVDKKIYEQLSHDHSQLREQEELREHLTKIFVQHLSGMMQCILGNAELLKVKYAHKLNREAADYLHKIESNSEDLINLLNEFQNTTHSDIETIDDASGTRPMVRSKQRTTYAE
jgi:signal transduction histidine kinase